tara:strand:- start:227191 stop:227460 length:270 start_codon:yes stop_codon:yes gene_type:complete
LFFVTNARFVNISGNEIFWVDFRELQVFFIEKVVKSISRNEPNTGFNVVAAKPVVRGVGTTCQPKGPNFRFERKGLRVQTSSGGRRCCQ